KITQALTSQLGGNFDLNAIKDKFRPILQQFLGSRPQGRADFDAILQQIVGAATSALPGIVLGLVGKREAVDARINLNDILALADKLQLQQFIPQVTQFLSSDKLQQLQNQFFATVVAAAGNNWNPATLGLAIQQIVTQFVPQLRQMRIDWEQVGQSALNGLTNALPGILIGAISLFGKREAVDARINLDDILALADKLQLQQFIPQVTQFLSSDKLQQLQNQFFATVVAAAGNHWNPATLGQAIQQIVTQFVPQLRQMRIDWEELGQSALNGLANALPSILMGALSLFGKRDAKMDYEQLIAQLPTDKLAQIVQLIKNTNKNKVLASLRKLLQSFFPGYQGRINFDDLAANVLNHLNSILPVLSQSITNIFG
ncbi:unnamed protein product, partial [Adineta ricciae]